MRRGRVMEGAKEWVKLNCDDRGNQVRSNVGARFTIGLKRVVPTD